MEWQSGNLSRYKWLSGGIIGLLVFDLVCNSSFLLLSHHTLIALIVYILQNVASIFCFILLAFGLFSTSSAQTGFVGEILHKFRSVIVGAIIYLFLSIAFHWSSLDKQWASPDEYIWSDEVVTIFTFHRLAAVLHYYLMKRTILRLSDGKFYIQKMERAEQTISPPR